MNSFFSLEHLLIIKIHFASFDVKSLVDENETKSMQASLCLDKLLRIKLV